MALIEIDGLPGFTVLKNGWIFPWQTVSHNQMLDHVSLNRNFGFCIQQKLKHTQRSSYLPRLDFLDTVLEHSLSLDVHFSGFFDTIAQMMC